MAFRYPIKKGAESRIFANARNLGNGTVESDEPLESIYLEPALVSDGGMATAEGLTILKAPASPTTPPQTAPVNQANPPLNEQSTNKEESK
jgi:hypothetical protein